MVFVFESAVVVFLTMICGVEKTFSGLDTTVCGTKTLFQETETIFYVSETGFSITEKGFSLIPAQLTTPTLIPSIKTNERSYPTKLDREDFEDRKEDIS
jgi:hypothetical protein